MPNKLVQYHLNSPAKVKLEHNTISLQLSRPSFIYILSLNGEREYQMMMNRVIND